MYLATTTQRIAILAGLILSLLSATPLCSSGCTSVSKYQIFGGPFYLTGAFYFLLLFLSMAFRDGFSLKGIKRFFPPRGSSWWGIPLVLSASGLGAELYFVGIQKYGVKAWCPVCLSIFTCLVVYLLIDLAWVVTKKDLLKTSAVVSSTAVWLFSLFVGFTVATAAVSEKKEHLTPQAQQLLDSVSKMPNPLSYADIWMGNLSSPVEVYFITDWYCPHCRLAEKDIEAALPQIGSVAKYTWLDLIAHPQTLNIVPYSTSLLLGDKANVINGRQALLSLTEKGKIPSGDEVRESFKKTGIVLDLVRPDDQKRLLAEIAQFCGLHKVRMTPSVLVLKPATGDHVLIEAQNVTKDNIVAAVNTFSGVGGGK